MTIFYVTTTVHISSEFKEALGSTTHTFSVAKELRKLGHEVHIVSEQFEGDKEYEQIEGIHIHRLLRGGGVMSSRAVKQSSWIRVLKKFKIFPNMILARKVARLIKQAQADIVLERGHSLGVGAMAARLSGRPFVLEVIDHIFSPYSLKKSAAVIAYTTIFFPEQYKEKVTLVHAGYDPTLFYPLETKKKYDVAFVGSFKEWEGLEDLVEAAKIVVQERPQTRFLLIGSGVRYETVNRMISKSGLQTNFTLAGKIPLRDVSSYLCEASIGVAPYNTSLSHKGEFDKYGFYFSPLKIFEYMACGLPIVATGYPIIQRIVTPEVGLTFPPEDIRALAGQLLALLNQPEQIKQMAFHNIQLSRHYTWSAVADTINQQLGAAIVVRE
ncbi:MAG: glycosyltransferase [Candidatus Kerfeldbacteria bacterium]